MKLYLIRHGRTLANLKRLYCGSTDLELLDESIKELESLKPKYQMIDKNKTIFYSSGKKRANKTLEILFDNVDYIIDKSLEEMNFGDFEMKSYEELKNNKDYLKWIEDDYHNIIPNGESGYIQEQRVIKALNNILKNKDKDIVIVTHGGTIHYIYNYLLKTNKNIYETNVNYGSGYLFTFNNGWEVSEL